MAETWFTIHRSALLPGFSHAASAVDGKTDISILSHVLFSVAGDRLRLRGTNLDMQVDAECELMAPATERGFTLPSGQITDILRHLPESAEISFGPGRSADQVGIRSGRSTYSVPSLPGSDFPQMRGLGDLAFVEFAGARLADAIDKATYAINKSEGRIYLTGLCLHADAAGTGMVLCGTNGLNLARIEMQGCGSPAFPTRTNSYAHIILPLRPADSIRKLLDGSKVPARIAVSDQIAVVALDGVEIATKLIDGIFPPYERVIPPKTDQTIIISREAFSSTVKRVNAVMDDRQNDGIRLKVLDGALAIDLLNAKGGFASDVVACECNVEDGFTIAHSAASLEKTLSTIKASDIELMLTSDSVGLVVRPVGNPCETYIVSPMRPRFVAE